MLAYHTELLVIICAFLSPCSIPDSIRELYLPISAFQHDRHLCCGVASILPEIFWLRFVWESSGKLCSNFVTVRISHARIYSTQLSNDQLTVNLLFIEVRTMTTFK